VKASSSEGSAARWYADVSRVVLANDLSPSACEAMRTNVALNGVAEVPRPPRANGIVSKAEGVGAEAEAEEEVANKKSKEDEAAERTGRREGARGGVRVNEGDAWSVRFPIQ
jgi:tRNA (guanine26-N2/guanine27-N2)-dimethyltransferase